MKTSFLALVALLAAVPAAALPLQDPLVADEVLTDVGVEPGHTLQYRRAVAFDFDGDLVQDVALVNHDRVEVLAGPSEYVAPLTDVVAANDLDVVDGGAPGGGDRLAVVNATGLQVVAWDGDDWVVTSLETSDWAGALFVRAGAPESAGAMPLLVGIMADGVSVRRVVWNGSQYEDEAVTTAPGTVQDLDLLEWDGDGIEDLAFRTATTLDVHLGLSSGGFDSPATAHPLLTYTYAAMAVGRQWGAGSDWIAYVITASDGVTQFLGSLTQAGPTDVVAIPGNLGVNGLGAGRLDRLNGTDLVLTRVGEHKLSALGNYASGLTLPFKFVNLGDTWEGHSLLDLEPAGTPAPNNTSIPLIADFDNDGDGDVVFAVQSTASLEIFYNRWSGEVVTPGLPLGGGLEGDAEAPLVVRTFEGSVLTSVELEADITHDAQIIPTGSTHTQVILWIKDDVTSSTRGEPLDMQFVPLPTSGPIPDFQSLDPPFALSTTEDDDAIYFLQMRYVDYDEANEELLEVFSSKLYGFQLQDIQCINDIPPCSPEPENHTFLKDLGDGTTYYELSIFVPDEDFTSIGSIVPIACIPDYAPGEPPVGLPFEPGS